MPPIVEGLIQLMAATGLSYAEVAAGACVSPGTVRCMLALQAEPARPRTRERIRRFIASNAGASRRSEVRFTDHA